MSNDKPAMAMADTDAAMPAAVHGQGLRGLTLADPPHRLHPDYQRVLALLQQLGPTPVLLDAQDCQRAAAQLLMEALLSGLQRIDRLQRRGDGLLAIQQGSAGGRPVRCIWLHPRQATAYSVAETSHALDEALAAFPGCLRLPD